MVMIVKYLTRLHMLGFGLAPYLTAGTELVSTWYRLGFGGIDLVLGCFDLVFLVSSWYRMVSSWYRMVSTSTQ